MKTDFANYTATRYLKDTDYPTMEDIDKHGKKIGFLCVKKRYDVIADFMPGDVLEATQEDLIQSLRNQETALQNWKTVGFRIRMIQAFNMMHKLADVTPDNNDPTMCPRMVIERNSRIVLYWDVISGFSMILSYFLVPYQIAFGGPYSAEGRAIEISLDVVFLITLLLRLITDRYSEPGQKLSGRQVAFNYITGYFIFDLASFFPHLVTKETYLGYSVLYKLKLFRYINLYGTLS